jgi:hypothetical protein
LRASYNLIYRGAAIELMVGFDYLYHSSNATANSLLGCTYPWQLTERNNGPLALLALPSRLEERELGKSRDSSHMRCHLTTGSLFIGFRPAQCDGQAIFAERAILRVRGVGAWAVTR